MEKSDEKKNKNKRQRPLQRGSRTDNNGNEFTFAVFAFGYNFCRCGFSTGFYRQNAKALDNI